DLKFGGKVSQKWLPRKGVSNNAYLKAILPVNVFGQPAELDKINDIAQEYDLKVIEDSCESLGAEYKGKLAGTFGDYGVFAFYPNKQITTGEGGVIITNNEKAASYMRALRNQGRSVGDTWLQHTYLGYNYRLDEMSAALGVIQMSRFYELMKKRDQVAAWYGERLGDIQGVEIPIVEPSTTRMSWFVYVIRLDPTINRDMLIKQLAACGIPARPYFTSIHLQPYMIERFGYQVGDFPVTEDLSRRGIALPFSGVMSEEQVEYVCKNIYYNIYPRKK
ncbi:MAG: DegT/DnrJ/EryC1/StrS family aminotransferase, partial [Anaerolineales bacterium]|nr:DegT/DnrJ/EryC1/StrS family aminotransferase [Anaerolineales bacterium]